MDKSPYASYLHTNYSPTASEILEIKDFLTKPLARLTSIKAKIDRLNSIVEKLYDEHRALNAEIEAHRALLSPLRQVPLDIMEEIFIRCLPTDHNAVMSTREAPLLLGRVCGEWRSITLSTPRLWASLHIPSSPPDSLFDDSTFDLEIGKRCKGAAEWIRRSGECPLSISLHTSCPRYHSDSSVMQPFGEVSMPILPSSKRWKNFSFRGLNDSFTHFQKIAEGDVPMLESLGITIVPGTFLQFFVATSLMDTSSLLSAPKLRKLSLTYFRENLLSLPVRWSQLTHLTLDAEGPTQFTVTPSPLTYSQVGKVLKNCILLVSCSLRLGNTQYVQTPPFGFSVSPSDFSASPSEYTFTLPLLQRFCLVLSDKSDEVFLKYLDLPVLRHLEMSVETSGFMMPSANRRSDFMDLIAQHGNKLKHLVLDISSLTQDDLICCLQSVPHITHLHLINSAAVSILDEVADLLTASDENPDCLCPMLEEFRCKGSLGASFSESHLLSFAEKRCVPEKGATLKRVDVTLHRNKPKDLQGFLISLDSRIECGRYLRFEELDDAAVDARIFVDFERCEGLDMTVVDIHYALTEPDTSYYREGPESPGGRDRRSSSSESSTQSFILRV